VVALAFVLAFRASGTLLGRWFGWPRHIRFRALVPFVLIDLVFGQQLVSTRFELGRLFRSMSHPFLHFRHRFRHGAFLSPLRPTSMASWVTLDTARYDRFAAQSSSSSRALLGRFSLSLRFERLRSRSDLFNSFVNHILVSTL
jgi:hypothetical protein